MTIAVVSDIHGNRQALEAVLADIAGFNVDHIVNLGDVVGYGADPEWCVRTVREAASISILGNHDVIAADIQYMMGLNPVALLALSWTMDNLSEDSLKFLRGLGYVAQDPGIDAAYVHASLPHPRGFGYLLRWERIKEHLEEQEHKLMFVGHSHIPDCWSTDGEKIYSVMNFRNSFVRFDLRSPDHSFVNVGSVGQPRDGDRRAGYALVEIEDSHLKITNRRVEYDVESAQRRIRGFNLPESLAKRLDSGK